jgi:hypothetical protein
VRLDLFASYLVYRILYEFYFASGRVALRYGRRIAFSFWIFSTPMSPEYLDNSMTNYLEFLRTVGAI